MDRSSRRYAAVLILVLVLLAGCGPTATVPPAGRPSPAPGTAEPAAAPDVTLADDGRTITLTVGQRFLLNLGADYTWTVTLDDQAVVSRVVGVLVIRGAQGLYEARQSGQATLTATGDPVCRGATPPCAAPSRQFRVEIVVR
jgi:hypothetical protein